MDYSLIRPDLTFDERAEWARQENYKLKRGIGKVLLEARLLNDGIAIYYSQPSLHSATLARRWSDFDLLMWDTYHNSLWKAIEILEDVGLQGRLISDEQVKRGELRAKGWKALILPYTQALSADEAQAIRQFTEEGGVLIADVSPGIMDDHGRLLSRGLLDDVFGVEREPYPKVSGRIDSIRVSENEKVPELIGQSFAVRKGELGLQRGEGESVARYEAGTPALVVNEYGRGRAVLLNFFLGGYSHYYQNTHLYTMPGMTKIADILEALLAKFGIVPRVSITESSSDTNVRHFDRFVFRDGEAEYVGIIRDYKKPFDLGQVADFLAVDLERAAQLARNEQLPMEKMKNLIQSDDVKRVRISFPRPSYLYELRSHRFYGHVQQIEADLRTARAQVFALMPYRIQKVQLQIPRSIRPGDRLASEIRLSRTPNDVP